MTETVEERLKRIAKYAKLLMDTESTPNLNIADLNWLIARAELVQKLEFENRKYLKRFERQQKENERLREENDEYRMKYENSGSIFSRRNQLDKIEELATENKRLKEKHARLLESYKELVIQENAMQGHYNLAFNNMQMFKKCLIDITIAMNTERPADEKTRDIRQILDSMK